MSAQTLPPEMIERIPDALRRNAGNLSATARELGVHRDSVRRYGVAGHAPAAPTVTTVPTAPAPGLPVGKHEAIADALGLPAPHPECYDNFVIDTPGRWLLIPDVHIPWHDRLTLELAAREGKRRGLSGVLLTGDALDYHELSDHDKDPGAARYVDEIEKGRQFLSWLRQQFPKARVVYKEGNHEERLTRYVMRHAPALYGLDCLTTPELLKFADVGSEWVGDRRVILLGKLPVIHGHEYKGSGGMYPARWLYQKTHHTAVCGHFHRPHDYTTKDVLRRVQRAWTMGCCCYLNPHYLRHNEWVNGVAFVEVAQDGTFVFENKQVFGGQLV